MSEENGEKYIYDEDGFTKAGKALFNYVGCEGYNGLGRMITNDLREAIKTIAKIDTGPSHVIFPAMEAKKILQKLLKSCIGDE